MKKLKLFITIFLSFNYCLAQIPFSHAYHDHCEQMHSFVVSLNDDFYFTTLNNDGTNLLNYGKCFLYRHDKNGNLKLRQPLPVNGSTYINGFFQTLDKKLLLLGTVYNCDAADTSVWRTFITKLDTNGTPIFYTPVNRNVVPAVLNDGFKCGVQYLDSSYYAFTDSVMYHFSKSGQVLASNNLGLSNISSCHLLINGKFLLSATQGTVSYLVQLTTAGSIVTQYQVNARFNKMLYYDGPNLMGLGTTKKLYRISSNYQLIDSSNFGNLNKVRDFITMNDSVFSLHYQGNTQMLRLSDTSFNAISQSTTTVTRLVQGAICRNRGLLAVLSNCNSDLPFGANNSFVSLNVFTVTGGNNYYNYDVRVGSMSMDSSDCSWYSGNYYPKLRAKVWIKNLGPSNVNKVKLNCYTNTPALCGLAYWQRTYSGLNLAPGDSVQVTTDFVSKFVANGGNMQPTISVQYCFYTTAPNDDNDLNVSNDGLCANFTFTSVNVEGVGENSPENGGIKVYPNPFEEDVTITSISEVKSISVYSAVGQLLCFENSNGRILHLKTAELKPGIYFVKVETGSGYELKKIIKQ